MSLQIECVVVTLNPPSERLVQPFRLGEKAIEDYFLEASDGDIQLTLNYDAIDQPLQSAAGAEPFDLNFFMDSVLGNADAPARKIALVLADFWPGHGGTFGLMFDLGFNAAAAATRLPREGAAVFLSTIRSHRASDEDFALEAMFTAVHELGHVFNLGHLSAPNLMATSQREEPYRDGYLFNDEQRFVLRHCSTEAGVYPGGLPYGTLGGLVPVGDYAVENRASEPVAFGLELVVDMDQREFFYFEPVQLELTLRVMNGIDHEFCVPDCLDPGYEAFDVWIEEPTGERRRYRPPARYCHPIRQRVITPREPFERDISVFGEGGGYTFHHAGVHTIWTTLTLGSRRLESNKLEVNVLPRIGLSEAFEEFSRALLQPTHANLLFYRARSLATASTVKALEKFAARFHDHPAAAHVHYALGRSLVARGASSGMRNSRVMSRGMAHLERAYSHAGTSRHQRKRAAEILRENEAR